jgi:hypothetical protein
LDLKRSPNKSNVALVASLHHIERVENSLFFSDHKFEDLESADLLLVLLDHLLDNMGFFVVVEAKQVILELFLGDLEHVR